MNRRGVLHKIMLGVILLAGLGLVLVLPQVKKATDVRHARQAAALTAQLALAEQAFYARSGFYTADFSQLGLALPCPVVVEAGRTLLRCAQYDYELAGAQTVRASHRKYPQWFVAQAAGSGVKCGFEAGSWAAQRLCEQTDLNQR